MNQSIKIKDSELAQVKELQSKYNEVIFKLGNLKVEQMELDKLVANFVERNKSLTEEYSNLQQREKQLIDEIVKAYGEGSLNLADGTFTPAAK